MTTQSNVSYLTYSHVPAREDRDWATAAEVVIEAGITYRQLDYWCRTGLLETIENPTPGSGWVRRFPDEQVHRAYLIRVLLEGGLSLTFIRERINEFMDVGFVRLGDITITLKPPDACGSDGTVP